MDTYIGTKIVLAEPRTEYDFRAEQHQPPPAGADRNGYKVVYEDGYVSWSPKETFERAYRMVTPAEAMLVSGTYPVQTGG